MIEHMEPMHVAHLLPAYLTGTLADPERGAVAAHLTECPTCRAELAAWGAIQRAAREVCQPGAAAADEALDQVWRRIDAAAAASPPVTLPRAAPTLADERVSPRPARQFAPLPLARRPLAHLATAALLVLTLAASFLAFGPGRPGRQDDARLLIPTISGTPTTPAPIVTRTLLDAPVAALPTERNRVVVDRWRLQPSPATVTLPAHDGVVMIAAASGEITVTADGIERQLLPGDAIDVSGREFSFRAAGATPAITYVIYVVPGMWFAANQLWLDGDPLVHAHDAIISSTADKMVGGPGRLFLDELTVPPGSALPAQAASSLVWTEVGAGVLGLTLDGERLPFRWQSGTERKFHQFGRETFPLLAPGTTMLLRNAGDEPLVLYRLTIVPRGPGTPSTALGDATPRPP